MSNSTAVILEQCVKPLKWSRLTIMEHPNEHLPGVYN